MSEEVNTPRATQAVTTSERALVETLTAISDPTSLLATWRSHEEAAWAAMPSAYSTLAGRLLAFGEPLLAYDTVAEGLKYAPQDARLRQMFALSLARSGATEKAHAVLRQLHDDGHRDEETLGLLARTYKDLWLLSSGNQPDALREARRFYLLAYESTGGYWTGINAATLTAIMGERQTAVSLAERVRQQCLGQLEQTALESDTFWLAATLGEAALVQQRWDEALQWYEKARAAGSRRWADVNSARRNAELLVQQAGQDWAPFAVVFRLPGVAMFTGHMIDSASRAAARFPIQLQDAIKREIVQQLRTLNVGFGYASAACGSDILFLEAMSEVGAETCIVLPYEAKAFRSDSVEIAPGGWGVRFDWALRRATQVVIASTQALRGRGASFRYGNRLLTGLSLLRAQRLQTDSVPIAVWDGRENDASGGTAETVLAWQARGLLVNVIDPTPLARRHGIIVGDHPEVENSQPEPAEFLPEICGLLFADAVGFSKLREDQIPTFVESFLGAIAKLLKRSSHVPVLKNTWGDGLYFVFENVNDAGLFALELCDMVSGQDWAEFCLPESLALRIGLHAGPVYACFDPVLERRNYVGTHVSRAARIEPITPPGHVYASESFAALAAAEGAGLIRCEYVGQTPQAKGYGTFPTYVVRRAASGGEIPTAR